MTTSFVSVPKAPAFPCTAPPTVPGMVAANSRPPMPFRPATAATCAMATPAVATMRVPSTFVSFTLFAMTTPRMPLSATRRFVPPPRMKNGRPCCLAAMTASMRSSVVLTSR